MTEATTVLVTGVGGRSVGHQILHALQRAAKPYRIVTTDADPFSFGLYHSGPGYLVPLAADPGYLPAITRIIEREGIQVLLPGTEPEVTVLARHRDALAKTGCTIIVSPPEVVDLCFDKGRLYRWLAENRVGVPPTADADGWEALADAVGYPIVGKPTRGSGGSRGVEILADGEEVLRYLEVREREGTEVVFQAYVGSAEQEYTVGVMTARDGTLIDTIVMHRKLIGLSLGVSRTIGGKHYALSTGYSQGFIVDHAPIAEACEALVRRLGIVGPANVQLRLDGDAIVVFEVHPRFSGTTSIRADVGFNEPDVLIRNYISGEVFGRLPYRRNVAAIRSLQHVIVPTSVMDEVQAP